MTLLAPRISWKSRGRLTGLALLLAGFTFVNGGQYDASAVARTGLAPEPEIISDWEITSFQAAARQHLDRFFQSVIGEDGVARQGAAVRVALPTIGDKPDMIWVTPFAERGGEYFGTLTATPRNPSRLSEGDLISFTRSQIVDWSFYGSDGRMYGNFTTRMMLHTVNAARAAEIAALLTDTAAPEGW